MKRLWASLKIPTLRQGGLLAVVLVVTFYGGLTITRATVNDSAGSIEENQQLVTARIGDLLQEVSTNGTVTFPIREWQSFEPPGTVGEVLVLDGDKVVEGQALARLDAAATVKLELALVDAQITLRDAQDELAALLDDTDTLKDARDARDTSVRSLANAVTALTVKQTSETGKVSDAEEVEAESEDAYANVFRRWFGIDLSGGQLTTPPSVLLSAFGIDLAELFEKADSGVSYGKGGGLAIDDPTTPWDDSTISSWRLYPGVIQGSCEPGEMAKQNRCVSQELDAAWDTYEAAVNAYASAVSVADTAVFKAEQVVAKAETTLKAAEDTLTEVADGPDALAVARTGKAIEIAIVALDDAKKRLDGATLRASMAGVVSQVTAEAGDVLAQNRDLLEIVDPTVVEIDGIIDEIDVLSISEGVPAFVSIAALSGQVLNGTISSIGTGSTSQQGVVTYPVQVRLEVPEGLTLREGLSATASVVISQINGALLVPTAAVQGNFVQPFVQVMKDGMVFNRPVTLGGSDDFWVQVVAGLVEGEMVVMDAPDSGAFTFGGFGSGSGANSATRRQIEQRLRESGNTETLRQLQSRSRSGGGQPPGLGGR